MYKYNAKHAIATMDNAICTINPIVSIMSVPVCRPGFS